MNKKIVRIIAEFAVVVIVAVVVGSTAFYIGYSSGVKNPETIIVKGVTNIGDDDVTADFDIFWQAWKFVKGEHIEGDNVSDKSLVHGSITGMVGALNDPNTIYFPPEDAKKFEEDVRGSFGGIGAEIGVREKQIIIVAPLKNSPAERVGLKSGDAILTVDGEPTSNLDVIEAVKIIRGPEGKVVTLTILRDGWVKSRDFDILREIIQIPTLEHDVIDSNIAHIQLFSFNENAPFAFYESVLNVSLTNGIQGVILDLRNNPGGFLEVAVNLAGWFLDRGSIVVSEEFRSGDKKVFRTSGNEVLKDFPVVVLINSGSASASEILAGALRDQRGVKLIGEKSFGKGSIQELKQLKDDSSLKLTVARWLLPNGAVIEKNGLEPDYVVELTEEDVENNQDPQLDKAVEVLQSEIRESL
jgi:carboxyl-terminal processing protease